MRTVAEFRERVRQEIGPGTLVHGLPILTPVRGAENTDGRHSHPGPVGVTRVDHHAMQAKSTKAGLPLIARWMGRKSFHPAPGVPGIVRPKKRGRLYTDVHHSWFALLAWFDVPKPVDNLARIAGKPRLPLPGSPGATKVVAELDLRAPDHLVHCRDNPAAISWIVNEVKHLAVGAIGTGQRPRPSRLITRKYEPAFPRAYEQQDVSLNRSRCSGHMNAPIKAMFWPTSRFR